MQRVFEALASAPRRKILALLAHAEMSAGDIASRFAMTKPAISKHLSVLEQSYLPRMNRKSVRSHANFWNLADTLYSKLVTEPMHCGSPNNTRG